MNIGEIFKGVTLFAKVESYEGDIVNMLFKNNDNELLFQLDINIARNEGNKGTQKDYTDFNYRSYLKNNMMGGYFPIIIEEYSLGDIHLSLPLEDINLFLLVNKVVRKLE